MRALQVKLTPSLSVRSSTEIPLAVDPARKVLIALEVVLAIGATFGAYALFVDGDSIFDGVVTAEDLPFESWTLAAIALFAVNVVLPLAVVWGAARRQAWAQEFGHFAVAGALAVWILVQIAILGFVSVLQPVCLTYAAAIAALAEWERRAAR